MKSTLLAIVAATAMVSAQNFPGQPACAIPCVSSAIAAAGCQIADVTCQCGSGFSSIQAIAAPCLIAACTGGSDLLVAASVGLELCSAFSRSIASASAVTTGATSVATSATTTRTSTSTSFSSTATVTSASGASGAASSSPATTSAPASGSAASRASSAASSASVAASSVSSAAAVSSSAAAAPMLVAGMGGLAGLVAGVIAVL